MHLEDLKTLKRFKEIAGTLAKYGFAELVDRLDPPGADWLKQVSPIDEEMSFAERVRAIFEELGPTFVKFGQVMSLRPDLVPEDLLQELEKLQDQVPPVPAEEIGPVIEEQLGRPVSEIFSEFDFRPVAAASLSQVHRGILRSNTKQVAVKVQRPNIRENIKSDLDILEAVFRFWTEQIDELRNYELVELVRTVRRSLVKELDFNLELSNMDIARSYSEQEEIRIPVTFKAFSSDKLLIMEFFDADKFQNIVSSAEVDRRRIARLGLHAAVKQILEDGFFHADPHPGNLLVDADDNLCIIDWGMVGRLTERDRFNLISLLSSVVDKDSDSLVQSFLHLCKAEEEPVDKDALQRDLLDLLDQYHALPLKEMDIGRFLMRVLSLLREYRLQLPMEMVVMVKALVTAEGTARLADPELNIIEEIEGHVHRISRERYRPGVIWKSIRNSLANLMYAKEDLPNQLYRIIKAVEQGELSVVFQLDKLERLISSLENASNLLTIGIITGSIIIGSSMIITTGVRPFLFGLPALGVIGYLLSVVLGLWLAAKILRNRKY